MGGSAHDGRRGGIYDFGIQIEEGTIGCEKKLLGREKNASVGPVAKGFPGISTFVFGLKMGVRAILFGTRIARWFMGGELLKTFFAYYLF